MMKEIVAKSDLVSPTDSTSDGTRPNTKKNKFPLSLLIGAAVVALSLCLSGCMVMPSMTAVAPKVTGTVRDAATGAAISGASIRGERVGFVAETRSKADGSFSLPRITQWGYLAYLGSPGTFPTPWWCYYSHETAYVIRVTKPGYGTADGSFVPRERKDSFFSSSYVPRGMEFVLRRER